MSRPTTPGTQKTGPRDIFKDKAQPEADKTLEERIERLEERLDETLAGENGPTINRSETRIDRSEAEDALVRAVSKSNRKRDGGKP